MAQNNDTAIANAAKTIREGGASLGIELGSTRIKAVLIGADHAPIASGNFDWENKLEGGYWTYSLDDVWAGLRHSFAELSRDVMERYGEPLAKLRGFGVSGMMHGYLAFDADGELLVPFRTWRNTNTEKAAAELTALLNFNLPIRWNASHLYQAVLNGEDHLDKVAYMTTLSGYVHWKLTGRKVIGVGEASGMFPIDSASNDFDAGMVQKFDALMEKCGHGNLKIKSIFPTVLIAGEDAGALTADGARLLDPSGALAPGVPMCPPEGDGPTGMVATNSVATMTGNVSAGTSIFAMAVIEKPLSKIYPEIDMITTPDGKPVAMVHGNNCTSDLDAWVRMFAELNALLGADVPKPVLYDALYNEALKGDPDCGGVLAYNYVSGEPITGFEHGRPLLARTPDANFTLANFMRSMLFGTMAALKIGMDIIVDKEHIKLAQLTGHGGLFKTKIVGQRLMAAALSVPIAVMESAGEGGAWGMAILAAYGASAAEAATGAKATGQNTPEPLAKYLDKKVFKDDAGSLIEPDAGDVEGFARYIDRYIKGLPIEKAAVENLN
ncbi:MAG: FGGY-family carbohydrate kinase [Oscillospiraceae bacterium]|nr:FGGY-family carbohydrate kinase [Oscillospiraceae bacterium]